MENRRQDPPSQTDYLEIVRALLKAGANINAREADGSTALMNAARYGCVDIVRLLLDWEADISLKTGQGYTALMYAAWQGHTEIVNMLIERGADVNSADNRYEFTSLVLAAGGPRQHDDAQYDSEEADAESDDGES